MARRVTLNIPVLTKRGTTGSAFLLLSSCFKVYIIKDADVKPILAALSTQVSTAVFDSTDASTATV